MLSAALKRGERPSLTGGLKAEKRYKKQQFMTRGKGAKCLTDKEKRDRVRGQLRRWGRTADVCRRKQAEIAEYTGLIAAAEDMLGAQLLTGMPRGTDTGDPTANAAQRASTLRKAYQQRIDELHADICMILDFARCVDDIISELPPEQQEVIDRRYKNRWSWERVAARLHMSDRQARRVEERAVGRLAGYMDFNKMQ